MKLSQFKIIIFCFLICFISNITYSQAGCKLNDLEKFIYRKETQDKSYLQQLLDFWRTPLFNGGYAIIISIGKYDNLQHLTDADKDALKMKDFLLKTNEYDEIAMLQDEEATFERIRCFMQEYFPEKMKEGRYRFLFYFSGHGTQDEGYKGRTGSLLLKEATGKINDTELIDMKQIEGWADRMKNANHMLFLLDCCFSGLAGVEVKGYDTKVDPKELAQENGRHLITAGGASERSIADSKWRGSLFTDVLITGMSGDADDKANNDGVVTIYELFSYTQAAVKNEAKKVGHKQTPLMTTLGKYDDQGQYFFVYKKPDSGKGIVIITSYFNGKVWIDGNFEKDIKNDDKVKFPLSAGKHLVEVHTNNIIYKEPVIVEKGTESVVSVQPRQQNPIGMTFIKIQNREYISGSPENESGRDTDETQHRVVLTKDFYMQATEITQAQWEEVMGENPSHFKDCGDHCPVENVSWEDVDRFIKKLNEREGKTIYRLPTEAEWEYACRAGSPAVYSWGDNAACSKMMYANDKGNINNHCVDFVATKHLKPDSPAPVMSYELNGWDLYDMHGNVKEWCKDVYGNYPNGLVIDPKGPRKGDFHIVRGGGWKSNASFCRSASRDKASLDHESNDIGFRLVMFAD